MKLSEMTKRFSITGSEEGSTISSELTVPNFSSIEAYLRAHNFINPNETYKSFLLKLKIISPQETPNDLFLRVATLLAESGKTFYGEILPSHYASIFNQLLSEQFVVLSTSLYTNAGRYVDKPLSACAVVPVKLDGLSHAQFAELVSSYHQK